MGIMEVIFTKQRNTQNLPEIENCGGGEGWMDKEHRLIGQIGQKKKALTTSELGLSFL